MMNWLTPKDRFFTCVYFFTVGLINGVLLMWLMVG